MIKEGAMLISICFRLAQKNIHECYIHFHTSGLSFCNDKCEMWVSDE